MDVPGIPSVRQFLDILDTLDVPQHVISQARHRPGHTLDLVIVRKDDDILGSLGIAFYSQSLSDRLDHYLVHCSLNMTVIETHTGRKTRIDRNFHSCDSAAFAAQIVDTLASGDGCASDRFEMRQSAVAAAVDVYVPVVVRTVRSGVVRRWFC